MSMAVYMLGFSSYMGFKDQMEKWQPRTDEEMLERKYAYAGGIETKNNMESKWLNDFDYNGYRIGGLF